MLVAGDRPQWAAAHDVLVEHEQGGVRHKVPPSVKQRLDAPLAAVPRSASPRVHASAASVATTGNSRVPVVLPVVLPVIPALVGHYGGFAPSYLGEVVVFAAQQSRLRAWSRARGRTLCRLGARHLVGFMRLSAR